jgi:hypothetical protein
MAAFSFSSSSELIACGNNPGVLDHQHHRSLRRARAV